LNLATPILDQTALEELGPPQIGLGLKEGVKLGGFNPVASLKSRCPTGYLAVEAGHEDMAKFGTSIVVL
jgi:hypothetical protein